MVTKTKHIPATPDLLRIGQVVEVNRFEKGWVVYHIQSMVGLCEIFEFYAQDFEIRIPRITHEDILNCGWECIYDEDPREYKCGVVRIRFFEDMDIEDSNIDLWEVGSNTEMEMHVQTLLDLKDLMRFWGIQ